MKIASSEVALGANYTQEHILKEKEHYREWVGEDPRRVDSQAADRVELSNQFTEVPLDPKLMRIIRALEVLTGKKINIQLIAPNQECTASPTPVSDQQQRQGWGIEYSYEKTEMNSQKLHFAAKGNVTTEDGRQIDFRLNLSMQQQTLKHESTSFKAGDALIDPIVINFGDGAVSFSDIRHNLDLDLDGKKEEFSFVSANSGFLVLDKNNDNKVNDGSELFGPNSGDGFDDLRVYDEDKNGWIDENDSVFEKLQVWTKDEEGNETFYSLKDVGVGALYLNSVVTPFEFQDGNMAQSSIFLRENGSSGMISEVDLRV